MHTSVVTYKYDGTNGGSDTTTNAESIKPSTRNNQLKSPIIRLFCHSNNNNEMVVSDRKGGPFVRETI